jgi:hypothetical protein
MRIQFLFQVHKERGILTNLVHESYAQIGEAVPSFIG